MVDVATLGVRVDTSGLMSGKVALAELTKTGANTEKAMTQAGASVGKVGKAFSGNSGNVRMFAQQLSQVAQQGAATGQWAQALAIQAADIGLAFGVVGMAIGAAIPVVTAMGAGFLSSANSARNFDEAIGNLHDSVASLNDLMAVYSASGIVDLKQKYGELTAEVLNLVEAQRQLAISEAMANARETISALSADMNGFFSTTTTSFQSMFNVNVGQANELAAAFARVRAAATFEEQAAALANMRAELESLPNGIDLADKAQRDFYQKIVESEDAMRQLSASAPSANWMDAAIGGVTSLGAAIRARIGEAMTLAAAASGGGYVSSGRGGDPRQQGGSALDWQTREATEFLRTWKAPKVGGGGGGRRGGGGGISEAAREQQQALRKIEAALEGLRSPQEVFNEAIAEADALMDSGALSMDKYTAYVDSLKLELQDAEFGDLIGDIESLSQSLADAIVNSGDLGEVFSRTLRKMASDVLASGIQSSLMSLFGLQQKKSSGSGLFGALFGNLLSFDGGGYTGDGPRTAGLDGKGGFLAMMHPNETVIDHTKGQGAGLSLQASQITLTDDGRIMATVRAEIGNASQQARSGAVRDTFKRMGSTKAGWGR